MTKHQQLISIINHHAHNACFLIKMQRRRHLYITPITRALQRSAVKNPTHMAYGIIIINEKLFRTLCIYLSN